MKSKNNLKGGIVVLVLLLAIGFAAVTTTLYINGTINIAPSEKDFRDHVIFNSASATGAKDNSVQGDANADASISDDGRTITFTTQILDIIGEESVLTYTIKNESSYDALLGDMKCSWGSTYVAAEADKTLVDDDGYVQIVSDDSAITGTTLANTNGISEEGTVTAKLLKSYVGEEDSEATTKTVTFTCRIDADAVIE